MLLMWILSVGAYTHLNFDVASLLSGKKTVLKQYVLLLKH